MPSKGCDGSSEFVSYPTHAAGPEVGCVEDSLSPALIALASLKWSTPTSNCAAAAMSALPSTSSSQQGPFVEISSRITSSLNHQPSYPAQAPLPQDQPAKQGRDSWTVSKFSPPNSPKLGSAVVEIRSESANPSDVQTPPLSDLDNDDSEPSAPPVPVVLPKKKGRPPKKRPLEGEAEYSAAKPPSRTYDKPPPRKRTISESATAIKPVRKVYKKKKATTRAEIMPILTEGSPQMFSRYPYFDLNQLAVAASFHNQQSSLLLGGGCEMEAFDNAEYNFSDFPDEQHREEMEQMIDWSLTVDASAVSPVLPPSSPVKPTTAIVDGEPESETLATPARLDTFPFPYSRYHKYAQPDYASDPFIASLVDYDIDSDSSLHDPVSLLCPDQDVSGSVCCPPPPLQDIDLYSNCE